jgi:hypothetical protein
LLRPKVSAAWAWCPKALMTSCPETNSSTCAFSSPVSVHCLAKWAWERRATNTVIRVDSGTVATAIAASRGEIQSIMARDPHSIRKDMMSCVRSWFMAWAMLSMSFVARLRTSPRERSRK